jgi:hypothetical protein
MRNKQLLQTSPRRLMQHKSSPRRILSRRVPHRPLAIASLHGEVHRFTGIVDRMGTHVCDGRTHYGLCVRELRLADSGQRLDLDHWWFPLRTVWSQAGIREGDTVLFLAKVQRCTKGWADPVDGEPASRKPRKQVTGFGRCPRTVSVVRRRQGVNTMVKQLQTSNCEMEAQLALLQSDLAQVSEQRQHLLSNIERQQLQLQHQEHQIQEQALQLREQAETLAHAVPRAEPARRPVSRVRSRFWLAALLISTTAAGSIWLVRAGLPGTAGCPAGTKSGGSLSGQLR